MKRMFYILTICFSSLTLCSFGQTENNQDLEAIAKFVSYEGGDKIHFSKFEILKDLSSTYLKMDTVTVGYYFYTVTEKQPDTVLLILNKYSGQTSLKNYFICPSYNAKIGIQKAKIEVINHSYWEGCETGKATCNPLQFERLKVEKNWFLLMPCGGTETSVIISSPENNFLLEQNFSVQKCPPYLELTSLKDGKYFANMYACGLGGKIEFNLKTK